MDNVSIVFVLLIAIIWINPKLIYDLNKFYIGKIILLMIITFFSYNNIVLGLLIIFIYFAILDKYRYIIEGMENQTIVTIDTIGEIKQNKNEEQEKENEGFETKDENKNKIIISTSNLKGNGIDVQEIRDLVTPKNSNTFPISKKMFKSSDDVEPFNKMTQ